MTISVLDEVQDTFISRNFCTSYLCIQEGVKGRIGKVHANDVGGKLDAKCTALPCLVSMEHPAGSGKWTDYTLTWGQRMGPSAE